MKKLVLALNLIISSMAFAAANESSLSETPSLVTSTNRFELRTGFDYVNTVGTQTGSTTQPSAFTVGFNYNRELLNNWGADVGLDFVGRSVKVIFNGIGQDVLKANYFDVIYAASYTQTSELSWVSTVTGFLGGFTAIPMGDMSSGASRLDTQTSHGLYFAVSGRIPIGAPFDFGINAWTKWGLNRGFAAETGLDRLFSAGLGISAIY